eukprot:388833-Rhodomonas_salina.1
MRSAMWWPSQSANYRKVGSRCRLRGRRRGVLITGARGEGSLRNFSTRGSGGKTLSVCPLPGPLSEIYLSYSQTGRRTQAGKYLQPTSTVYMRHRHTSSGWVAECGVGA